MHKDINYEALQASHNLHAVLAIVNQQMTTIASLNAQLNAVREIPKSMYRHNDQLEELRNLQDKLQEEKTEWLKRKEQEERDLADERSDLETLKTKIRAEQIDIGQQRDELHKKMQILSNQGILSSANIALSPTSIVCSSSDDAGHPSPHSNIGASCSNLTVDDHTDLGANSLSAEHRRKDKWRSASSKSTANSHPSDALSDGLHIFRLSALFQFTTKKNDFLIDGSYALSILCQKFNQTFYKFNSISTFHFLFVYSYK